MKKYVCAFRGRRDSYQVPLALAEGDLLDRFITDAYASPSIRILARFLPERVREKVASRRIDGIPIERVRCLWLTTFAEHLRHRLGCARDRTFAQLDIHFSKAAAHRAAKSQSDLFLYSPYAWEAFTASYPHSPRRILFQYHPHYETEQRILNQDAERFPSVGESFSPGSRGELPEELRRRERDVWRYADLIICASSFTRDSLIKAGCGETQCRVIPYGIELPNRFPVRRPKEFRVLFVGSGVQRKGLHHLLYAWRQARLPASSKLVIVCRVMDRGIESIAANTPRIELHQHVSRTRLNELYEQTAFFVMPSLCEGFGQVYLEALAHGCPVLGTRNTGLPDVGDENDGVFCVEPGNVAALTSKLETLVQVLRNNTEVFIKARACAARHSWGLFRSALRDSLQFDESD
jgi:glycosyltransferase involved in cell wall biosynthesis